MPSSYRAYQQTGWPTVWAEFITWVINGIISGTTGLALFAAELLSGTFLDWFVPFADPVLLLATSLVLLPPPFQMLKQSFFELVGKAPAKTLDSQRELEELMPKGFSVRVSRIVRLGRVEHIALRVACKDDVTVKQCDAIRRRWQEIANDRFPNTYAVIVFSNHEHAASLTNEKRGCSSLWHKWGGETNAFLQHARGLTARDSRRLRFYA